MRIFALFGRPEFLRGFHGWMTLTWAGLMTPTVLVWHSSILWIALMSVWANFASHFSAWQASRVEVQQDQAIDSDVATT